jgi:hypothetical protein
VDALDAELNLASAIVVSVPYVTVQFCIGFRADVGHGNGLPAIDTTVQQLGGRP